MIDGEWDDFVPIRLPVDWEYRGEAGIHPEIEGITGKKIPEKSLYPIALVVVAVFIFIGITAFYLDLTNPINL